MVYVPYHFVEVEESLGAVDVMKRRERSDGSVNVHWLGPDRSSAGDEQPQRVRATHEHLDT